MRILQVIPFFTPEMGGSAQVAYQISRRLAGRGHAVTVVTSDYAMRDARFEPAGFEVVALHCTLARWGFYLTPALIPWVKAQVAEFDVIHMHTVRTFQNAVVRRYAARRGVPYVLSAHGTLPVIVQRRLAKRAYDLLFGRVLLAGANRLIAVSPAEVEQYVQAGIEPGRVTVILNGLDLQEFAALPPRGTFRREWNIGDPTRMVLFLGRLHQRKGIDHLITAFARVHEREPDSLLVITGPDEGELHGLQALVDQLSLGAQVCFTGPLYGKDKLAAYVDADVLASPAVHEIFGLVPFEALLCGTPVIVTDDCGSGQLLSQAGGGFLVPYADVEELARAISRALNNPNEAMERTETGGAYVREHLDWDRTMGELESTYVQVSHGCAK